MKTSFQSGPIGLDSLTFIMLYKKTPREKKKRERKKNKDISDLIFCTPLRECGILVQKYENMIIFIFYLTYI